MLFFGLTLQGYLSKLFWQSANVAQLVEQIIRND